MKKVSRVESLAVIFHACTSLTPLNVCDINHKNRVCMATKKKIQWTIRNTNIAF